jgi:hypothetical protein
MNCSPMLSISSAYWQVPPTAEAWIGADKLLLSLVAGSAPALEHIFVARQGILGEFSSPTRTGTHHPIITLSTVYHYAF